MIPALRIYNSSLGRKYLMSLTGLFLCSFLVVHLSGNISLFFHDEGKAFNLYTQFMSHNLLIRLTEFALLGGFVMHIVDAVFLRIKNNAARPQGYAGRPRGAGKGKSSGSFLSRTMIFSGSLILFFLVVHLKSYWYELKFGEVPTVEYDGVVVHNAYAMVVASFHEAWYCLLYVLSIVFLGAHLNHGFQSAFQSLGLKNKVYSPLLEKLGNAFSLLIIISFSIFPIYFYFTAP